MIEHPAVTEVCKQLESNGFYVTYLPVDEFGAVDPGDVEKAITSGTTLVTIMHANNEVGTIQPISEIAEITRRHRIVLHTDAAQSAGKISTRVDELGVSLLSLAGHKLYAPKGVGALFIRRGTQLQKLMHGADHEMNRRAGTENVLEIVGLGKACEIAGRDLKQHSDHMREMRDRLERGLLDKPLNTKINGHPVERLPNTLSVSFQGLEADVLLSELNEVAASAGAACHSDSVVVSSVLTAMGVPSEYAMGTIRFSVGRNTTPEEIDITVRKISAVVRRKYFR
jgi:cysteine sulfinate desulfinase/cysteine desulfurase-like protein